MTLVVKPIADKNLWEQFRLKWSPESLFQSWDWGEVEKKVGKEVERIGLFHKNNLIGIAQIIFVNAKRGKFLHIRHGPILNSLDFEPWQYICNSLIKKAHEKQSWFIRISPLKAETVELTALLSRLGATTSPIHAMDGEVCWVLDLDKSESELLSSMRKSTRYDIRKSEVSGVNILIGSDTKSIENFMSLYESTSQRQGFVGHTGVYEEIEYFSKEQKGLLLLGSYENKILAGAFIVFDGYQAIYHHGASVASPVPVSVALQWRAIQEAKKKGMKLYNFWGIAPDDNPKHPWRGITLFKKGFGGRQMEYIHAQDISVSPLYHLTRIVEVTRKLRKHY